MRCSNRVPRTVRLSGSVASFSCAAVMLVLGFATGSGVSGATRDQVEADWRLQDESRLRQIREPGLVRFAETELAWPGIQPLDAGLLVPQAPAPVIDGCLDEAAWKDAALLPPGPADQSVQPVLRLAHDDQRVFLSASFPTVAERSFYGPSTKVDAAGAVDGVRNGRYAFHTGQEANPWWQVDLGSRRAIAKIVVYNRLDYPPGLHNADQLVILVSDDQKTWTRVYENRGKAFGGATDKNPLVVDFAAAPPAGHEPTPAARFVRIQIPSPTPVFLHLDEVEIFGPANPNENMAAGRPADQSSLSPWSRGAPLATLGGISIGLADGEASPAVTINGTPASPEQARSRRDGKQTCVEIALPRAQMAGGFPSEVTPFRSVATHLAAARGWQVVWPDRATLGFGTNRLSLEFRAKEPLDPPVELTVESVVFTSLRPQRQRVFQQELSAASSLPLEFSIDHEGPAALVMTARQAGRQVREGRAFYVQPVSETLARTRRLLAEFQTPAPPALAALEARAQELSAREKAVGPQTESRAVLCREARWLGREVAMKNPLLGFDRLLLVKRFTQETYPDVCLNHMPWVSRPGGDLCVVSMADPDATVHNLLAGALGPGHVHGMDLWWDGDRVVFGYAKAKSNEPPAGWLDRCTSFDLRRTEEPTHLFEIGIDGKGLRQLTHGEWSDLDPTYLPNGDIAFVSERCAFSLQCNELDKDETSCNLYVMRPDGSDIRRLSVSKDGDYLPHTLDDGTIGYTRWEYQERSWANIQSIWTVHPDGTGANALFKQHFNDPWALEDVRSIPGSTQLVAIATGHHTLAAGPVVIVNPREGMNNPVGIRIVSPNVTPPEGGMSGRAVAEGGVPGRGGFYMTPWALSDKFFLVSFGYGRETDPVGYGIYLIDVYGTKELIYRDPAISCFAAIPLRPRVRPPVLPDITDPKASYAVCSASDIARGVEGVPASAIRYLRISQGVGWPYCNTYGGQRYEPDVKSVMVNWNPIRVIGTVPIETDGSAHFQVPVDTPLYFQILDENHMELRRMRSFISFQPGEARACTGCHETREETPAASIEPFPLAMLRDPSVPVPPPWGDRTISFLRDVQPVFDKHCTACHGGLKPAAGLDFGAGLTASNNRAYDTLLAHALVSRSNVGDDSRITEPLAFGSHRSKLVQVLREGACSRRANLSNEDWLRLVTWIDANGPYHDDFINKRQQPQPYDLPNDRDLLGKITGVHARRCSGCHQPGDVSRADWVDLNQPTRSRFLLAPLAKTSGGSGRCSQTIYKDEADPDYQAVSALLQAAVRKAWDQPRRDLKALKQSD